MSPAWHGIRFLHDKCGRPGTLLEVCARADGHMLLSGLCICCGEHINLEFTLEAIIITCALKDCSEDQPPTLAEMHIPGPVQ